MQTWHELLVGLSVASVALLSIGYTGLIVWRRATDRPAEERLRLTIGAMAVTMLLCMVMAVVGIVLFWGFFA